MVRRTGMSCGEPTAPTDRRRTVSRYVPSARGPGVAVNRIEIELPDDTVTVSGATWIQAAPRTTDSRTPSGPVAVPPLLITRVVEPVSVELRSAESEKTETSFTTSTGGLT